MPRVSVQPTAAERIRPRPGDELVAPAEVVMDRGFTLAAAPDQVWPWLVQLGKNRAGWYLPRSVERWLPRRALRRIDPRWQRLAVGDVIPDYGGKHETFTVEQLRPAELIAYSSVRGRTHVSWVITLEPCRAGTRVQLRLRLAPVKRRRLAEYGGGLFDWLTILGLAAGLAERVEGETAAEPV